MRIVSSVVSVPIFVFTFLYFDELCWWKQTYFSESFLPNSIIILNHVVCSDEVLVIPWMSISVSVPLFFQASQFDTPNILDFVLLPQFIFLFKSYYILCPWLYHVRRSLFFLVDFNILMLLTSAPKKNLTRFILLTAVMRTCNHRYSSKYSKMLASLREEMLCSKEKLPVFLNPSFLGPVRELRC